jgi:hypothetical protein
MKKYLFITNTFTSKKAFDLLSLDKKISGGFLFLFKKTPKMILT